MVGHGPEVDPATLGVHSGQHDGHPPRAFEAEHVGVVHHRRQLLALRVAVLQKKDVLVIIVSSKRSLVSH